MDDTTNEYPLVAFVEGEVSLSASFIAAPERMTVDQCIAGWLDAKSKRSESAKTKRAYEDTLFKFRAMLQSTGRDVDGDSNIIAPLAQGWAGKSWEDGKSVSSATFNQRLAILSSFYQYAIRHGVLAANPIERVERRTVRNEHAAHDLSQETVIQGLENIDRATAEGKRDYTLLAVMLETGRRVAEIAGLRWGHIVWHGDTCAVEWVRCKGNKPMKNSLTPEATTILRDYLKAIYQDDLKELADNAPIWISFSDRSRGKAIGTQTIERICKAHFGTSKAHATRHTWAVSMEQEGATLSEIGAGLGHSNLATTSRYMERHRGYENKHVGKLAKRFGYKRGD